ncbi:MAG TPA: UDP-glucuronic acid decarboxylase family protein [Candidatus Dormibacteraeota bacterium]
MPRAVVSGGAGFIGSHLCDALLARGWEVLAIDSLLTGSERNVEHLAAEPRFQLARADVAAGVPVVDGRVDAVLHLASPASPADFERLAVEILDAGTYGTRNLLELAAAHGARFLLASTSEVYGDPEVHPQPESYWGNVNPIGRRSCYDEAKRAAEAYVSAFRRYRQVDTRIVRIFNTYGPRMRIDDGRAIPNFLVQALRGIPLTVYGDGSQTRSLCHVRDLAGGILAVLERGDRRPYNVGNPHEVTVSALAALVIKTTGSASSIENLPLPEDDPRRRCPDITRVRGLGWEPQVQLEDGLRETVAYFQEVV